MPQKIESPYYPIIYVRGYAGTDAAVEETVATPYMGFNLGSTTVRQRWTGAQARHVFESPLVRLMKDHGYLDAYDGGGHASVPGATPARSVFIYRYYDEADGGNRSDIEAYAAGLGDLIVRVRELVCGDDTARRRAFRVHLVAHSMGGLICRCLLQNPRIGTDAARAAVDRVFTYATPHNGIDLAVIGNVPGFFSVNNADNFNRERMAGYLDLAESPDRVDDLAGRFDADRFFCLVGTDDRDYENPVRRLVGPMSDGLVRIANATVRRAPRAFVHRSHSGTLGIVNSEEGYQNLSRFLFGDVRVDGVLRVRQLTLPPKIQRALDAGERVRASYHFEAIVRCRGAVWDLHRRTAGEQSAVFRTFNDLFGASARDPYLFSAYLSSGARVNRNRRSLGFSVDLGVLVPDYEIDRALWLDDHHEGGYLFRDKLNFELTLPSAGGDLAGSALRWGLDSRCPNRTSRPAAGPAAGDGGAAVFTVPVRQRSRPGIDAELELRVRPWS